MRLEDDDWVAPMAQHAAYARDLLERTYCRIDLTNVPDDDRARLEALDKKRREEGESLVMLFTSCWMGLLIIHHCYG